MRPITILQTNVGDSVAVPLDLYLNPFNATIQCVITGGPTYTVQYTNDNVYAVGYVAAAGNWFNLAGITAAVANAVDSLISPVTAIRLRVTAVGAPTDSVQMRVTQAGAVG